MWKKDALLFLVISVDFVFLVHGDFVGRFSRDSERELQLGKEMNLDGIVKIAKTENGQDIVCVDVYKQPAFNNPLLKNHKLQWQPTTFPNNFEEEVSFQRPHDTNSASQNFACPPNSIPIRKVPQKILNDSNYNDESNSLLYRFALLEVTHFADDAFYGASSLIKSNIPHCENGQNSGVSVWIASDNTNKKNVIKAGWMVYPEIYGDTQAHLSIYWTSDGFHQTGCYDHLCSGFIQLDNDITLGVSQIHDSVHGSINSYYMGLIIFQDISTKHWWLMIRNPEPSKYYIVGYWPKEIFNLFEEGGTVLNFGGSTMAHSGQPFPPMGEGYFPDGRKSDSNYIGEILYVNKSNSFVPPRPMGAKIHTDNSNCYGIIYHENDEDKYSHYLFLGGPGGQC